MSVLNDSLAFGLISQRVRVDPSAQCYSSRANKCSDNCGYSSIHDAIVASCGTASQPMTSQPADVRRFLASRAPGATDPDGHWQMLPMATNRSHTNNWHLQLHEDRAPQQMRRNGRQIHGVDEGDHQDQAIGGSIGKLIYLFYIAIRPRFCSSAPTRPPPPRYGICASYPHEPIRTSFAQSPRNARSCIPGICSFDALCVHNRSETYTCARVTRATCLESRLLHRAGCLLDLVVW